jgi:hypothetical protein
MNCTKKRHPGEGRDEALFQRIGCDRSPAPAFAGVTAVVSLSSVDSALGNCACAFFRDVAEDVADDQ